MYFTVLMSVRSVSPEIIMRFSVLFIICLCYTSCTPYQSMPLSFLPSFVHPLRYFTQTVSSPCCSHAWFLQQSQFNLPVVLFLHFYLFVCFSTDTRELLGEMDGIDVLLQQLSVRFGVTSLFLFCSATTILIYWSHIRVLLRQSLVISDHEHPLVLRQTMYSMLCGSNLTLWSRLCVTLGQLLQKQISKAFSLCVVLKTPLDSAASFPSFPYRSSNVTTHPQLRSRR